MTWYAAHIIISVHPQKKRSFITIYENVILINARSISDAEEIAKDAGRKSLEGYADLEIDGVSTVCNFEGVRKIINISNPYPLDQDEDRPVSGTEITYTEFQAKDVNDVREFANGKEVNLKYID